MSIWQSAADAAIAGLVAAAKTIRVNRLPEVHDTLVITDSGADEVLVVAGVINEDNPGNRAAIEHQFAQPGYDDQVENFTVWSEIGVTDGNANNLPVTRTRCYEILRDWARAIEADQTLGTSDTGLIVSSWISRVSWTPQQPPSGALSLLMVGVDCQAITNL